MALVELKSACKELSAEMYVLSGGNYNLVYLTELRELNLLALLDCMLHNGLDPVKEFPSAFTGLGILSYEARINLL